jgi:hypothetical protein
MPGIETLHEHVGTSVSEVTFRWQGMSISLEKMWLTDGTMFLFARPDAAIAVELITGKRTAKWTMLSAEELKRAAGASTTSSGSAPNVTEPNT